MTPPPYITVPDWADRFRKKAAGAGSTIGQWRTGDVEIARGPMLAITEPGVATITVMVCTQLMKTALIEHAFGFFATSTRRRCSCCSPRRMLRSSSRRSGSPR